MQDKRFLRSMLERVRLLEEADEHNLNFVVCCLTLVVPMINFKLVEFNMK